MNDKRLVFAALTIALTALPAAASDKADAGRAQALQKLVDCRKLTDSSERLACYDRAASALDEAEAKGDIVVVDREQAQKVRRQAFGFSMPSISLFEKGENREDIDNMTGVLASARQDPTGRWVLKLEDGAVWTQVETDELSKTPKAGMPVTVRRAALGSYMMKVGNQTAFRARRVQ